MTTQQGIEIMFIEQSAPAGYPKWLKKMREPGGHNGHNLYDREDELAHCKVCGGAEASMPTRCPGGMMTSAQQDAVQAGTLDFNKRTWWVSLAKPVPSDHDIKQHAYTVDPECWVNYSGQHKQFKQRMDSRRTAALAQARKELA